MNNIYPEYRKEFEKTTRQIMVDLARTYDMIDARNSESEMRGFMQNMYRIKQGVTTLRRKYNHDPIKVKKHHP